MIKELLEDCKNQWIRAKHNKKHPFRFFTLATVANDGSPHLRTVVLRDYDRLQNRFVVFTDLRSQKISELKQDPRAQLFFYDPKKLVQIVVSAKCISINQNLEVYSRIPDQSKKDYTTKLAPGIEIKAPDQVDYLETKNYFTQLIFNASSIEYLRLKRPNHLRARFSNSDQWEGVFLNP
ncbi:MAG: pyridoxamine 5'-phosphate oxidase family protein [Flavobacteriaceae bacterium]